MKAGSLERREGDLACTVAVAVILQELDEATERIRSDVQTHALGSVRLGRELLDGVIAELRAEPPRPLNAIRLARHLWEVEVEMHYVATFGAPAIEQVKASNTHRRVAIARDYYGKSWRTEKNTPKWRSARAAVVEAGCKQRDAEARVAAGATVAPTEWGLTPGRRRMLSALGRRVEMEIYYGGASWFSHPSVQSIGNLLSVASDGRVEPPDPIAEQLPFMGASLAIMSATRLATRANWILGPLYGVGPRVSAVMSARGIPLEGLAKEAEDGPS